MTRVVKPSPFQPLFGTNHAFNGLMDYFYVGNHQNSVGLKDLYINLGYLFTKGQINLTPHIFNSAAKVIDINKQKMDTYLGTEIDLTATYKVQKDIVISAGYSQMYGSSTLERLKNGDASKTNNWAWLMVSFQPQLLSWSKKPEN